MEREEISFAEYWFIKKNELFYKQNDGTKAINLVKKISFVVLDDKVACIHRLMGNPSSGERYAPKDGSKEFEIIEKLSEKYVFPVNVDDETLEIECDVYSVKFTK